MLVDIFGFFARTVKDYATFGEEQKQNGMTGFNRPKDPKWDKVDLTSAADWDGRRNRGDCVFSHFLLHRLPVYRCHKCLSQHVQAIRH